MNRTIRILLTAAAALAILVFIGGAVLRHVVEKELAAMDLGQYRLVSGGVRVNLLRRTISLRDVRLITDTDRRDADTVHRSPLHYLDASIGRITLQGIRLKGIRDGIFRVGTLSIESPHGRLVTFPMPADTTRKSAVSRIQSVEARRIRLSGGALDWQRIIAGDTLRYSASGLDVSADGFRWDPTPASRIRVLFSDSLTGRLGAFRYTFAGSAYTLALDTLAWNAARGELTVRRTELQPQYTPHDFPRRSIRKSDWMALNLDRISCMGVDFAALWNERQVKIDSIHIPSGSFATCKDRGAPVPERVKPMIHTSIQQIGIPLTIGRIRTDSLRVEYLEQAVHAMQPGSIVFEGTRATIYGVTNRVSRPNQYIELYADTRLMGTGKLTAVISLPVDPANDRFEVKATLLATPFPALNPMIEPLARVELKAGWIDRMDFTMTGGSTTAKIDMILRYSGLKVSLIRESHGLRQERAGLSNLINWAVVKPDNPDRGGLRTASETVRRDPYRSSFNYLWKGISAGAMETAETGAAKRLLGRRQDRSL